MTELIEIVVEVKKRDKEGKDVGPVLRTLRTKLEPYVNQVELARFVSLLTELHQTNGSYQALKKKLAGMQNGKTVEDPRKAVEAFDAEAELESTFMRRSLKALSAVAGELQRRERSGDSIARYDMQDVAMAATQFVEKQSLTEGQEGNSGSGSGS